MTTKTEFHDPTPDLTDEERNLLRRAGASSELLRVCSTPLDELEAERHSTLMEVKKYLREWESLTEENVAEFSHLGGHFFSALWDGDLWRALGSADQNNREIMIETFGVVEINQSRPSNAAPIHG